jgi:hypothetical protein
MYAYEIVEKYLRKNGYAGLKSYDNDCSCCLDKDYAECDYFGSYDLDADRYQRARLLPDGSGVDESSVQGLEVEE